MHYTTLAASIACLLVAPALGQYPAPICTGVCTGTIRDPSVIQRSDGLWLRYTTEGNLRIASAPSLSGPWETKEGEAGAMLPGGSVLQEGNERRLWAPNIFINNGIFYGYYCASTIGTQNSEIGVATSQTGESGSWTDHGSVGIPANSDYNRIDANLFRECETCPPIFNFGSSWQDIFQTELDDTLLQMKAGAPITNVAEDATGRLLEGAFQWWTSSDGVNYYYMFFSSGDCCGSPAEQTNGEEYKVMVCRGTSATGPFVDRSGRACVGEDNVGELVLESHGEVWAPGGQGLVKDGERTAMYYHYGESRFSRYQRSD
jgi:arabinan endo-1,5-alpha-L-arabinosidase